MNVIVKGLVAVGLGLALTATPATAQIKWQIGLGPTLPQGDFGDGAEMGFHAMGGVNFPLAASPVWIRADLGYHRNKIEGFDATTTILAVSGDAVYNFPGTRAHPYVLGGLTWASADVSGDAVIGNPDAETDIGFNFGGGVHFDLGSTTAFAEARYFKIGDTDFVPITVGVRF